LLFLIGALGTLTGGANAIVNSVIEGKTQKS
jgi:hypothetical protein